MYYAQSPVPDLRGHNHVQLTSPVRGLRAALRILQFKPDDRMFKPVNWVLLGGRPISEDTWHACSKPYTTPKSQGKFVLTLEGDNGVSPPQNVFPLPCLF